MTAWLASIVGVVVIGVVVDLMIQGRRMESFVRSIYSFIVLFVIVSPLPNLLTKDWGELKMDNLVNAELVTNLQENQKHAVKVKYEIKDSSGAWLKNETIVYAETAPFVMPESGLKIDLNSTYSLSEVANKILPIVSTAVSNIDYIINELYSDKGEK